MSTGKHNINQMERRNKNFPIINQLQYFIFKDCLLETQKGHESTPTVSELYIRVVSYKQPIPQSSREMRNILRTTHCKPSGISWQVDPLKTREQWSLVWMEFICVGKDQMFHRKQHEECRRHIRPLSVTPEVQQLFFFCLAMLFFLTHK